MTERLDSDPRETPLSRRQLLGAVGVGVAGGGAGSLWLGEPPESPGEDPSPPEVTDLESGVSESAHPYAVWQYHYDRDAESDSLSVASPINVVFPLDDARFEDVTAVFENARWTDSLLEYTLWAWDRENERYRRPHWSAAETFFGLGGRLHVRAWHFEGTVSIQAHVDSAVVPRHVVTSYADGRAAVETLFEDAGWTTGETLDLENDTPPDHDGNASVIRR